MTTSPFGTIAPLPRRVVAYVIDALIAAGIVVVLSLVIGLIGTGMGPEAILGFLPVAVGLIWLVMLGWLLVYTAMQAGQGSPGMRAQRIRLVRETDGAPLGFGRALLRNVVFGLSAGIVVGYFTPLFDGSGRFQGWHDKVAKSLMLEAVPAEAATRTAPPSPPAASPSSPLLPPPASPSLASSPPPAAASPAAMATPFPEETVAAPPRTPAAPAPAANDGLIAFVPGVTQDPPPRPSPVSEPAPVAATPAPQPAEASAASDDGEDVELTRISVPGHRLVFTWDDGTRVEVSRRTIFGRNPASEEGAALVSVRDETLSLSKTHFEAAAEPSGGWVMDRHSTNGMTIVRGGERITCAPGEKVRVRLGDALEIGDRIVTIGGYA